MRRSLSMSVAAIFTSRRRDCCPTSIWREPTEFARWIPSLDVGRPVVVACKAGKELRSIYHSRTARRRLRSQHAGRRQLRLERCRTANDRPRDPYTFRAKTTQCLGNAAAAKDRPHRLPVADPALHPTQTRRSFSSIRPMSKPRPLNLAASRSILPTSRFRTKASVAASNTHAQAVRPGKRAIVARDWR